MLGVDGCRGGWLGALVRERAVRWLLLPDAAAVLAVDAAAIGIDIPIGLPETGRRACDGLARRVPGVSGSSVFPVPPRAILDAVDYNAANTSSRALIGLALSKQTWHILDKVRDVDAALGDPPDARVVEVHPEVSFRHLDPRVRHGKKTAAGAGQRIRALATWVDVANALAAVPPGPGIDDALDALVVAWSAQRWWAGSAVVLPAGPTQYDGRDRPMHIVA